MTVRHIMLGSWPSRLDTIDLEFESVLAMAITMEPEESKQTLCGQIDRVGIESGVALRGGKAQDERGEQESKGQHVDLIALFDRIDHELETLVRDLDESLMNVSDADEMMMLLDVLSSCSVREKKELRLLGEI